MSRPRLRAQYLPVRLGRDADTPDYLVVISEARSLLINDPAAAELAAGLDGTREVAELVGSLAPRHSRKAGAAALRRLRALDLLTDGAARAPVAAAAAWDARGVDPDLAEACSRGGRIALVDLGTAASATFASALASLELSVDSADPDLHVDSADPDLHVDSADPSPHANSGRNSNPDSALVVLTESMVDPRLAAINRDCLATGRAWTLVRPVGTVLLLGPHFAPGLTGCWECLRQRYQENEQLENFLAEQLPAAKRVNAARASLPATATALAGLLAAEVPVLAQRNHSPRLTGQLVALDTIGFTLTAHRLVRQPQCPACGDPQLLRGASERLTLPTSAAPARTGHDGGTRTNRADVTYQRLEHHVSKYLGVVTRLTSLEPVDNGLRYSYSAGHNFAVARRPGALKANLRGQSGGKGRTDLQARVSAIGEAIERYCGVWREHRPTRYAAYRELAPDQTVHLSALLGFSDHQYAHRDGLNPHLSHFHRIPKPLLDDQPLHWSAGWSLTHDAPRKLPTAYCWYGHPDLRRLDVCSADSNGCAAGSSHAEAVLQGFCELVERDSVALWWYHRSRMPGVNLDSFGDPWLDALREQFAGELGRDLWALDLTADLGIPTFAAISEVTAAAAAAPDVLVGFGAHLDSAVALSRAVTEVNQFLPAVTPGTDGRTRYGITEPDTLRWFTTVRPREQPWLLPDPDQPETTVDTHRSAASGDVAADARHCVDLASARGLDTIVLDQSRPDIELRVVKVIVPGLRHFWRRLGPGRLWRVPTALGRHPLAGDEHAVNPLNVFF